MSRPTSQPPIAKLLSLLRKEYPAPKVALDHRDAFELLAATILSAQCTDERVNKVTPALFARFPDASSLASADQNELEEIIHSTGFYRNKTKSLLGMAQRLLEKHDGQVPACLDDLVQLPGVARKTANVVMGTAFGIATGVVVDTHVKRLSNLLGLTQHSDPVKIERDLMAAVPESEWIAVGHMLILHGRQVCVARRPACDRCTLSGLCLSSP